VITKDQQRGGYRMGLQPYDVHTMVTSSHEEVVSLRYVQDGHHMP
jgi:hypothetical protein